MLGRALWAWSCWTGKEVKYAVDVVLFNWLIEAIHFLPEASTLSSSFYFESRGRPQGRPRFRAVGSENLMKCLDTVNVP